MDHDQRGKILAFVLVYEYDRMRAATEQVECLPARATRQIKLSDDYLESNSTGLTETIAEGLNSE
jgi:hypothetical protein